MGESTIMMMSKTKVTSAKGTTLILSVSLSSPPGISIYWAPVLRANRSLFRWGAVRSSMRQEDQFLAEQAHARQRLFHTDVEVVVNQSGDDGHADTGRCRDQGFRDTGRHDRGST